MTKAEIVQVLYERVGGLQKREAAETVDSIFEIMKETLRRVEEHDVARGVGRGPHEGKRDLGPAV